MNNKKGVKLLAAVMVLAMAFAGIVVASEDSDAATPAPAGATTLTNANFVTGIAAGDYKLESDITINDDVVISNNVNIYGADHKIILKADIYISGNVTVLFDGCVFENDSATADKQIQLAETAAAQSKLVINNCSFTGTSTEIAYGAVKEDRTMFIADGSATITNTKFNDKKLTISYSADKVTIRNCSDVYLNFGVGATFDADSTTPGTTIVDIDPATSIYGIKAMEGTTLDLGKTTIVAENFFVKTNVKLANGTITADIVPYETTEEPTITVSEVTLLGNNKIDKVAITVDSGKKFTISGQVEFLNNASITSTGATFINNNDAPGSNALPATGNAKGDGWELVGTTLTLNGYNGSNVFKGNITSIILIGENTITLDANEEALIAIESTGIIAQMKTEATGIGTLAISISGDNAKQAIKGASGAMKINGVSIEIDIENTNATKTVFKAIDGVTDLTLSFADLDITVSDENDVSNGLSITKLYLTQSTLTVDAPNDGVIVTTKTEIAGSDVVINAGSTALNTGSAAADISNESVIEVSSITGYAFVGGFEASQGSSINATSMNIGVDTTNNATVINGGNMVIDAGKTFTNKSSFTNNGIVAVYGKLTNNGGETVNNGQINVYGYKAGTPIVSEKTFTDASAAEVELKFTEITPLADGTFSILVTIVKTIPAQNIAIYGTLTVVNKTLTIKAVDSDNSVTISVTYAEPIIGATFNAAEDIEKYSVIVSDGSFKVTNKDNANNTASICALAGLVSDLATGEHEDDENDQIITVTAGKLTNNGSMLINRAQAALVAGGELVNAGEISVKENISTTSGKLSGNAIIVSEGVTIDLTGTVDIAFIFAGEYTYTNTETEKEVTAAYDNQIKVVGGCKGVKFATSDIPDDEDGTVTINLIKNAISTGKTVKITLVKGAFTGEDSGANIFADGVTVDVLADVLFQATGDIIVNNLTFDGVLAVQDGATLNIKGTDPETYTYGKLTYTISFAKDGYTYYGSIAYALANASEGMTLILNDDGTISEDLTVGKGVTLQFAKGANLIISGEKKVTVTMLEGASFVFTDNNTIGVGTNGALVSGTFTYDINTVVLDKVLMDNASAIGMTVAGKTTPSNITLTIGVELESGTVTAKTGKLSIDADFGVNNTDKTASKLVVSKGAIVAESAASALNLKTDASAVIDGTLIFADNATIASKVTGDGSISLLDGKKVTFNGDVAQNITVANEGATDKVILIDMAANEEDAATTNTVIITSVKATGTKAAYLDISGKYYSGTIQVNGNAGLSALTVDTKAILDVPAGSTVTVVTESTVVGLVKVAGTINMRVSNDPATVSYATLKYDITYTDGDYTVYTIVTTAISNASAGDSFELTQNLTVTGDELEIPSGVTIIVPEDYKIIVGSGKYLVLGSGITTIGATGGIDGTVELTGTAYVISYTDSSMDNSKMKIVGAATGDKIVDSQITVLNQLYATVYAIKDGVDLSGVFDNMDVKITGYRFVEFTDAVGNVIDAIHDKKVGATDVIADMLPSQVQVTFTKVEGISYYVNNLKMNIVGAPVYVAYGATITAVADYGYEGTPLVNGKAYITIDNTTTTITGSGVSPASAPETSSDSGMGITDYLLIVLVVLAAILVVVVAIRMMRS